MRLFVAVDVDQACREAFHELAKESQARFPACASFTPVDNLHVTLAFLGEHPVPTAQQSAQSEQVELAEQAQELSVLDALRQELSSLRFAPFSIRLGGVLLFAKPKGKKLLCADVTQGRGQLCALAQGVAQAVRQAGIELPTRPYQPHLTLAKLLPLPDPAGCNALVGKAEAMGWPTLPVPGFSLFASLPFQREQGQSAVRYQRLFDVLGRQT